MDDLVAIAWLLTLAVLLLSGRYLKVLSVQPSHPSSTFFRLYSVFAIAFCSLAAVAHLRVGPVTFLGMSVLVWSSVVMLILVWRLLILPGKHDF